MYKKIFVLTEGQTETKFVKEILCPYFFEKGKLLFPCTIVTSSLFCRSGIMGRQ